MVLTLFKHEVARTWKLLLAVTGVPAVLALVLAGVSALDVSVISAAAMVLATICASLVVGGAQLLLIWDYWRSSYSAAGYLTHSIPVGGRTIFAVKLTWAGLVLFLTSLVGLLLFGLLTLVGAVLDGMRPGDYFALVGDVVSQAVSTAPWWLWLAGLALVVASLVLTLVQYYFAISIGYESRFARLGHVGPVVVYIVLAMVLQLVFLLGFVVFPFGMDFTGGHVQLQTLSLTQLFSNSNEVMPLGVFPVLALAAVALVWRTASSWNSRISLR